MTQYKLWVRVSSTNTMNTIVFAENMYAARVLGEKQYGTGNVLGCWVM